VLPIFPGHAPLIIPYQAMAPFKERKMMWLSLWETHITLEKYKKVTLTFPNKRIVAAIEEKQHRADSSGAFSTSPFPPIPSPFVSHSN